MTIPDHVIEAYRALKTIGLCPVLTVTVSLPLELETEPAKPQATARTVQWALNRLKAAAGQPNRELVRRYLFMRGWLGPLEEPDNWKLQFVPTSQEDLALLAAGVAAFEKAQQSRVASALGLPVESGKTT